MTAPTPSSTVGCQADRGPTWRLGSRIPLHVYEQVRDEPDRSPWPGGDLPVATFRDPDDARRAVEAVNGRPMPDSIEIRGQRDEYEAALLHERQRHTDLVAELRKQIATLERLAVRSGDQSSTLPPPDLPATLADVDDVRRVCLAAGLWPDSGSSHMQWVPRRDAPPWYVREEIRGTTFQVVGPDWGVTVSICSPAVALWHAIQAARSAA